jgi:hypothetical protein
MLIIVQLFVFSAILGIIIAAMEGGDFPGWGKMIACVLAAAIPTIVINAVLPSELFIIGDAVGALCAGFAIMATCGMGMKRAFTAASVYLCIEAMISTAFYFMIKS